MRVVVVENETHLRRAVAQFLRHEGFEVIAETADGEEALRVLDNQNPDLIVTDQDMPRVTGVELVRRLRARGNQTPVLMISGHDEGSAIASALAAGVNRYLVKPVSGDQLIHAARQTALGRAA